MKYSKQTCSFYCLAHLLLLGCLLSLSSQTIEEHKTQKHHVKIDSKFSFDYYSAYLSIVDQERMYFEVETKDIDVSSWRPDYKNGHYFAIGFPKIADNDRDYDLIMCKYDYEGHDEMQFYGHVNCIDSIWEEGETYKEDRFQDSAFMDNDPEIYLDLETKTMTIKLKIIKKYRERPGHQDTIIQDGQALDLVIVYGELVNGEPNMRFTQSSRRYISIQLDSMKQIKEKVAEEIEKFSKMEL